VGSGLGGGGGGGEKFVFHPTITTILEGPCDVHHIHHTVTIIESNSAVRHNEPLSSIQMGILFSTFGDSPSMIEMSGTDANILHLSGTFMSYNMQLHYIRYKFAAKPPEIGNDFVWE
jgi:hypothetical protein